LSGFSAFEKDQHADRYYSWRKLDIYRCFNKYKFRYFAVGSMIWDKRPTVAFWMVAILSFGLMLIPLTLIREPAVPKEKPSAGGNPLAYLRGLARETNVLKFLIAQSFWWLGIWMISSFLTLFVSGELKVSEGKSMWVPMVFSIVSTVFMLPLGALGDRISRKGILVVMLAFWAAIIILAGFSQSFEYALITMGIAGIPFAAAMGVGYAYLLDLIPRERTAEFVGFNYMSLTAPQLIGPLIGGKLIDMLGYRSIFPASAVCAAAGLIILLFVRSPQAAEATAEE